MSNLKPPGNFPVTREVKSLLWNPRETSLLFACHSDNISRQYSSADNITRQY